MSTISLNAMQEAFLKSGVITKDGIQKLDQETKRKKEEEVKEQKRKEELRKEEERKQKEIEQAWKEKEPKKKSVFDKMYDDPKKQKFLTHLVWNWLPSSRVKFLDNWEARLEKRACCLCNVRVISKGEMIEKAPAVAKTFVGSLPQVIDGKFSMAEANIVAIREVFKERVYLALSSKDSNAVMCLGCYKEFFDWVLSRLPIDEKIGRIVGRLRKQFGG